MCGKFTAMYTWRQVVAFSQPLGEMDKSGKDDEISIYRPMSLLPVIVFDRENHIRRVVPMRWGFPHRSDPYRPDPIHVRSETIDEKPTFKDAFLDGQRGIVAVLTFNEGKELENGKTEQHTITPGNEAPLGFAVIWRRYEIPGMPVPLVACVQATVPANQLISSITDRMPAFIHEEDWDKWIGEDPVPPAEAKELLRTVEGVNWRMAKEEKPAAKKSSMKSSAPPQQKLL